MADGLYLRVDGLLQLKNELKLLAADMRRKVVRAALRDAAKPIVRGAKALVPVLSEPATYRLPGTVRDSIRIRQSRLRKASKGELGVYIKPLFRGLGGRKSAKNPFDPFYYRFLETGTNKMRARPFLGPAFEVYREPALMLFQQRIRERIEKANRNK